MVTKANGRVGWVLADAAVPHPASIRLARRLAYKIFFMGYGVAGIEVIGVGAVAVNVGGIAVVAIRDAVAVGNSVEVGAGDVSVACKVLVDVGKVGTSVIPGVMVGTFGTQSLCPEKIFVADPMQLARCNWGTVVP